MFVILYQDYEIVNISSFVKKCYFFGELEKLNQNEVDLGFQFIFDVVGFYGYVSLLGDVVIFVQYRIFLVRVYFFDNIVDCFFEIVSV